jgi:hypothetical protein
MTKFEAEVELKMLNDRKVILQSIIDAPTPVKIGRIMSANEMENNVKYFCVNNYRRKVYTNIYRDCTEDHEWITSDGAFHDMDSAEQYNKYNMLLRELRVAQHKDGGRGPYCMDVGFDGEVYAIDTEQPSIKVSFRTREGRTSFTLEHKLSEHKLLILGV